MSRTEAESEVPNFKGCSTFGVLAYPLPPHFHLGVTCVCSYPLAYSLSTSTLFYFAGLLDFPNSCQYDKSQVPVNVYEHC